MMEHNLVETRVYISSSMDFKTRVRNWWMRLKLKSALQPIGLLIFLMVYTVAGGLVRLLVSLQTKKLFINFASYYICAFFIGIPISNYLHINIFLEHYRKQLLDVK